MSRLDMLLEASVSGGDLSHDSEIFRLQSHEHVGIWEDDKINFDGMVVYTKEKTRTPKKVYVSDFLGPYHAYYDGYVIDLADKQPNLPPQKGYDDGPSMAVTNANIDAICQQDYRFMN